MRHWFRHLQHRWQRTTAAPAPKRREIRQRWQLPADRGPEAAATLHAMARAWITDQLVHVVTPNGWQSCGVHIALGRDGQDRFVQPWALAYAAEQYALDTVVHTLPLADYPDVTHLEIQLIEMRIRPAAPLDPPG